jgi:hypothetical protein
MKQINLLHASTKRAFSTVPLLWATEYTHIFPLDITFFIELTINSIDMLGKAGWVLGGGVDLRQAIHRGQRKERSEWVFSRESLTKSRR